MPGPLSDEHKAAISEGLKSHHHTKHFNRGVGEAVVSITPTPTRVETQTGTLPRTS